MGVVHVESDAGSSDKVDVRNEIRRLVAFWGFGVEFHFRFRICPLGQPSVAPTPPLASYLFYVMSPPKGWGARKFAPPRHHGTEPETRKTPFRASKHVFRHFWCHFGPFGDFLKKSFFFSKILLFLTFFGNPTPRADPPPTCFFQSRTFFDRFSRRIFFETLVFAR